jgi:hypothetical protein
MNTFQRNSIPTHFRHCRLPDWLCRIAFILIIAAIPICLQTAGFAAPTGEYNYFLFTRFDDSKPNCWELNTLMMAQITPQKFELTELTSLENDYIELLGVFSGQAYWLDNYRLYRVALASNHKSAQVKTSHIHFSERAENILFTLEGDKKLAVRAYDLRNGTCRYLAALSNDHVNPIEASPDGKHLAFSIHVPSRKGINLHQLKIIDVSTGKLRNAGAPIRFDPHPTEGLPIDDVPFAWLSNDDILYIQCEGKIQDGSDRSVIMVGKHTDHVKRLNIKTGRAAEVAVVPGQTGKSDIRLYKPANEPTIKLFINSNGFVVDIPGKALIPEKNDMTLSSFRLRKIDLETFQLYHNTKMLAQKVAGYSVFASPSGSRILWLVYQPIHPTGQQDMYYYDAKVGTTRHVTSLNFASPVAQPVFWFRADDMKSPQPHIHTSWQPMQTVSNPK